VFSEIILANGHVVEVEVLQNVVVPVLDRQSKLSPQTLDLCVRIEFDAPRGQKTGAATERTAHSVNHGTLTECMLPKLSDGHCHKVIGQMTIAARIYHAKQEMHPRY
jgi:hypothetical protein